MKYKGIELKEITTQQIIDPPKKMLVWDNAVKGTEPRIQTVYAVIIKENGTKQAIGECCRWAHCAEIPEEPTQRRATHRELSKWLAQGNGEYLYNGWAYQGSPYIPGYENDEVTTSFKIRKWEDTEWHEPTVDYMGIGTTWPSPSPNELLDYELNTVDMPKYLETHYAKIGNQIWMSENLFVTDVGDGIHWNKDNCEFYYSWDAAQRIADKIPGWHLPSREEWNELANATGKNAANLRVKSWGGAHENSCFSAVPAGFWSNEFKNVNEVAAFWTTKPSTVGNSAAVVSMIDNGTSLYECFYPKYDGFSVRLVKDK